MLANELDADAGTVFEPVEKVAPKGQTVLSPRQRVVLLDIAFDNVNFEEALQRIEEMIASRKPHYVVTANVDFLVQARRDPALLRILNEAHLTLCDGTPLVWASRLLGKALRERVAGSDLAPKLIRCAAQKKYRMFFLGATPEANAQAATNVRAQFPNINIVGQFSPPFRPLAEMNREEIANQIRAARPDIVFVAFGCPKAEKWMAMNYRTLGVPVMIGVGGTIDFLAGRMKRAPVWMQRAGIEWIFRVGQEPRRLFKRYAMDLWRFSLTMTAELWRAKIRADHSQFASSARMGGQTIDGDTT